MERHGEQLWDKILGWPLPARDLLAVSAVVLAVGCVVVPALLGGADFKRSGDLVRTQPREEATLVEVLHGSRGEDTHYVQLGGKELEADYGWFIPDPTPGTSVDVVRDPDDPDHLIAVGTPGDWAERPWLDALVVVFALGFGLVAAFVAGIKLVPERADPVVEKLVDTGDRLVRWIDSTLQGWFGRDSPPSGRHRSP